MTTVTCARTATVAESRRMDRRFLLIAAVVAAVCLGLGLALVAAGLVQLAAIHTMLLAKDYFGRLRPHELLSAADGTKAWFASGSSFPSGHSAFYFGLLLPLAAACPVRWLRWLLIAIPLYAVLARIDMAKHFLSDVSASALMVSIYALAAAWLTARWLPPPARA
jgi:membrane-associated phospholipid phosphatase